MKSGRLRRSSQRSELRRFESAFQSNKKPFSKTELNGYLNDAIKRRQTDLIDFLIARGAKCRNVSLHEAIECQSLSLVEICSKSRQDINTTNNYGESALSCTSSPTIAKIIMQNGANPNLVDNRGLAPIHHAIRTSNKPLLEALLDGHAIVDLKTPFGYTPLALAVVLNHSSMARLLLERGADPNIELDHALNAKQTQDLLNGSISTVPPRAAKFRCSCPFPIKLSKKPYGLLQLAIEDCHAGSIKAIVDHGGKFRGQEHKSLLHIAVERGTSSVVDFVLKMKPDVKDPANKLVLNRSIIRQDHFSRWVTRKLLDYGFTLSHEDEKKSQVFEAVVENYPEFMEEELLQPENLRKGPISHSMLHRILWKDDVETLNFAMENFDYTKQELTDLLDTAIFQSKPQLVEPLLKKGGDFGDQPKLLFTGIYIGDLSIMDLLLKHGLTVKGVFHDDGSTPLHHAYFPKMIKYLLDHGAEIDAPNRRGITPLLDFIARGPDREQNPDIVRILLRRGANCDFCGQDGKNALHIATMKRLSITLIAMLAARTKDIDAQTKDGYTALHLACALNELPIVKILTSHGASCELTDDRGLTALHFAALYGSLEVAEWLISKLDNFDTRDQTGRTPINIACRQSQFRIVELLLANGADLSIPDFENKTYPECTADLPLDYYFHNYIHSNVRGCPPPLVLYIIKIHHMKLRTAQVAKVRKINHISQEITPNDQKHIVRMKEELRRIDSIGLQGIIKHHFYRNSYPSYLTRLYLKDKVKQLKKKKCFEYLDIIQAIVTRDKRRKPLLDSACDAFSKIVNLAVGDIGDVCNRLPPEVVQQRILPNLSNKELYNFTKACSAIMGTRANKTQCK